MLKKGKILFILLQIFLFAYIADAQSDLLGLKLTFVAKNKTIPQTLDVIERLGNFSFTYNSDIIPQNKIITLNIRNKSLSDVLSNILGCQFVFTQVGEKIVISPALITEEEIKQNKIKTKQTIVLVDTVRILVHDTIRVTKYDTVKILVRDSIKLTDTLRTLVKIPEATWSIGLQYQENCVGKTITNELPTAQFMSQQHIGAMLYKKKSFGTFGIGLGMQQVFTQVTYQVQRSFIDSSSFNQQTESYYRYKQVFSYYLFKDSDSVEIPIIDSSLNQITVKSYTGVRETHYYDGTNRYRMLTIPFSYSYIPIRYKKHSILFELLVRPEFLLVAKGSIVMDGEKSFALNARPIALSFSSQLSIGYQFAINSRSDISFGWWGGIHSSKSYFLPESFRVTQFWSGFNVGIKTMIGND